jgi:tetratricopeptide (TPR) repeat protein
MAAKVNTRFVVMLAVVLIALAGVVGFIGYTTILRSGDRLVRLGDEAMAAGRPEEAADFYSRAVNKDQGNVEWLTKWVSSIEKITPRNKQGYQDRYFGQYVPAMAQLARVQRRDVAAQRRFLDEAMDRMTRFGGNLQAWEAFAGQAGDTLRFFEDDAKGRDQLRRYRGMANVAMMNFNPQVSDEALKQTEEDLRAALAADPADEDSACALADFFRIRSAFARQNRQEAQVQELNAKAREVLTTFAAANPPAGRPKSELLRMELADRVREARGGKGQSSLVDVIKNVAPAMREMTDAVLATPPEKFNPLAADRAARLVVVSREEGLGADAAAKIMEHVIKGHPSDPLLLLQYGKLLQLGGQHEAALVQFKKLAALPDRPVSLDGLVLYEMRSEAVAAQVDSVLAGWKPSLTREQQDELLGKVKALRAEVADRLGGSSPVLTLIDGKIEFAQNNLSAARSLLTQYLTDTGNSDSSALLLLSRVLNRQGNTGGARAALERMLVIEPTNIAARMELARLLVATGDTRGSERELDEILKIDPTNSEAGQQLELIKTVNAGVDASDPVVATIAKVNEKINSGMDPDFPGAIKLVQDAIAKQGYEVRLTMALASLQNRSGDKNGAIETVKKGLEANPDNPILQRVKASLEITNPLEAQLATIETLQYPEWQKHLLRFDAYRIFGVADKAAESLKAAVALAPDEALVIEYQFQDALSRKDGIAEARALAEKAAQRNLDTVNGAFFRGRLLLTEGKASEGAAALQQAVELDKNNPQAWRFLGDARLELRQYDAAVTAYQRSLEIRPDQVRAIGGMIEAHMRAGRLDEALGVARANKRIAENDKRVREAWLTLEASAPGGDKDFALAARQQVLKIDPGNDSNRLALASLLMNRQRWAEARTVIDELLARGERFIAAGEGPALQLVQLDAQWYASQQKYKEAWDTWQKYIEKLPAEKRDGQAEVLLARMLLAVNQPQAAVEALMKGRDYQDKKTLPIDRELGDLYFRAGFEEKALEFYQNVLKTGQDEGNVVLRATLETMLVLGQFKEVDDTIKAMGAKADNDSGIVIIQAQAAQRAGDRARAKQLHDRAVAMDPNNPVVYDARAIFNQADRSLLPDIEADLKRALELNSRYTGARLRLASLYANTGRWDESIGELTRAVDLDPNNTDLRVRLIRTLIERQRGAEAVDQLNKALAREPENIQWLVSAGQIFTALGNPEGALPYIEKAWAKIKVAEVAKIYVQTLLRSRQPNLPRAIEVLNTPEIQIESNVELLGLRALIHTLAGRKQQADRDLGAAFKLTNQQDSDSVNKFFTALQNVYRDAAERLKFLTSIKPADGFTSWMAMVVANSKMRVPEARQEGINEIRQLAESEASDQRIRLGSYRLMGALAYDEKRFDDAVDQFKKALDLSKQLQAGPEGAAKAIGDAEINNNLGYTLGIDLKRPEEGFPYAEAAVRTRPREPKFLDTLGAIYLAQGNLDKAADYLQRAQDNFTSDEEKPAVFIHTARLHLARKNRQEAQRYVDSLKALLGANERLGTIYAEELKALTEELAR